MKKLITALFLVTVMLISAVGCFSSSNCFTGEWKFSQINSVELQPGLDQSTIDLLKQTYNAVDEDGIETNALIKFVSEGIFVPCYLNFDRRFAYTYDPVMDREATWKLYELTETTGFLSFYTELDATNGNPDPILYPDLVYNVETETMSITINYISFMVTVDLVR